jgi:hypothetical protein
MISPRTASALRLLHWTVGLVILLEAYRTLHGSLVRLHDAGHTGTLAWVRLGLSVPEMLAALLFLIPFTMLIGGYALLVIITLAIAIHGLHGDFGGLEILVLYAVAVYVTLASRGNGVVESPSKQKS